MISLSLFPSRCLSLSLSDFLSLEERTERCESEKRKGVNGMLCCCVRARILFYIFECFETEDEDQLGRLRFDVVWMLWRSDGCVYATWMIGMHTHLKVIGGAENGGDRCHRVVVLDFFLGSYYMLGLPIGRANMSYFLYPPLAHPYF